MVRDGPKGGPGAGLAHHVLDELVEHLLHGKVVTGGSVVGHETVRYDKVWSAEQISEQK